MQDIKNPENLHLYPYLPHSLKNDILKKNSCESEFNQYLVKLYLSLSFLLLNSIFSVYTYQVLTN